jgi:hypothetical protein
MNWCFDLGVHTLLDWIGVLFEFMFFVDTLDSRTVNTYKLLKKYSLFV